MLAVPLCPVQGNRHKSQERAHAWRSGLNSRCLSIVIRGEELTFRSRKWKTEHSSCEVNTCPHPIASVMKSRRCPDLGPGRLCADFQGPLFSLCSALLTGLGGSILTDPVAVGTNKHSPFFHSVSSVSVVYVNNPNTWPVLLHLFQ